MTDKQLSPDARPQAGPGGSDSFLGGGPKFNQAGYNAPLPGEKNADVARQSWLNARLLIGVILAVILVSGIWFIYGRQPAGGQGGRAGVSINGRPSDDPDAPPSQQQQ